MPDQDVLLATKLHVPRPRPGFVVRQRLLDSLDQSLARGLIVVCGPAGFGKTALLAGPGPIRRLACRGCGRGGNWPNCASPSCASRRTRRWRCFRRPPGPASPGSRRRRDGRLLDANPVSASRPSPAPVSGLVESLTSREIEVLELLAAGWPNQRIVGHLVVTLDTVKKHVTPGGRHPKVEE